jgi:Sap, sulfolipid-1-addressing protein
MVAQGPGIPRLEAQMGNAIGQVLPLAVGVALSPVPIIAVALMLMSQRARLNGPVFVIGWLVGRVIPAADLTKSPVEGQGTAGGTVALHVRVRSAWARSRAIRSSAARS